MFCFGCVLLPKGKKKECLVSAVSFCPGEKKGNEKGEKRKRRGRERKTKKGTDVSTSLFAFSLPLSSHLMYVRKQHDDILGNP